MPPPPRTHPGSRGTPGGPVGKGRDGEGGWRGVERRWQQGRKEVKAEGGEGGGRKEGGGVGRGLGGGRGRGGWLGWGWGWDWSCSWGRDRSWSWSWDVAGGSAEGGGEGDRSRRPVQVWVVPNQPGETQNHLEVAELHDVAGEGFRVHPMDAHTSSDVVGDGSGSGDAAVDQLDGDGVDMGGGVQVVLLQDGGVQEAVRRSGVDQGLDGDGRLAWDCQMHHETEVVGGGGGKAGGGERCVPPRQAPIGWVGRFPAPQGGGGQTGGGGWPNWVWG